MYTHDMETLKVFNLEPGETAKLFRIIAEAKRKGASLRIELRVKEDK